VGAADTGAPVFAQAWQVMDLPPWKEPGWRGQLLRGTLYEAGIHLVDYLMAVFGEKPRSGLSYVFILLSDDQIIK
jgi:predicted dehydrogenase